MIGFSVRNWWLMIAGAVVLAVLGILAVRSAPMDAIPDLSETQVMVYTEWRGHHPEEVERVITLPLSRILNGIAGVRTVRASSDEDFSLIHLIFEDGVAMPIARSRV